MPKLKNIDKVVSVNRVFAVGVGFCAQIHEKCEFFVKPCLAERYDILVFFGLQKFSFGLAISA